jgi:hypothetical protein
MLRYNLVNAGINCFPFFDSHFTNEKNVKAYNLKLASIFPATRMIITYLPVNLF